MNNNNGCVATDWHWLAVSSLGGNGPKNCKNKSEEGVFEFEYLIWVLSTAIFEKFPSKISFWIRP